MIRKRLLSYPKSILLIVPLLVPAILFAQKKTTIIDSNKSDSTHKVIIAGPYGRSGLHEALLGKHYRREWVTPVLVPVIRLDTFGEDGLTPYKKGGGRQSKTLRLRDSDEREFVLRSLDKSFAGALPSIYRSTLIEKILNDQVSVSHPYSALTVPKMAGAAKVYHTDPIIGYVPEQDALDSFNEEYGDKVYLLEQRPAGNWETAENFGNPTKIISTNKMLDKLLESHTNQVDQLQFVRSRLFDMFIGDWSRHEDQWRWGVFKTSDGTIYKPIPRDRDQAYSRFDGILPRMVLKSANLDHVQGFGPDIKKIKEYGFTARHLDRRCANEVTEQQWIDIAKELQEALTDPVIEEAVHQLPPEIFPISGNYIIATLKERRRHLQEFAHGYYHFLARHVDVIGSDEREYFYVRRLNDNETSVSVFGMDADGTVETEPRYTRVFKTSETNDVRLYGIAGMDRYMITGRVNAGIDNRIIGGPGMDTIADLSFVKGRKHKTMIYDDWDNLFTLSHESRLRLATDSEVHAYDYEEFEYHKKGVKAVVSYNNPDRVFLSLGYGFERHRWRKYPYGFDQEIFLRYSLTQNAFSLLYRSTFYQAVKKWNLTFMANYDAIRWTNFFGLGNDTKRNVDDINFYRLRTNELNVEAGLYKLVGKHRFDISAYAQAIEIINDPGRLVSETYIVNKNYYYEHHNYLSGRFGYTYTNVDNLTVPERGIMFYGGAAYTTNVQEDNKGFATFNGIVQFYVPLFSKFSLSLRAGASTVQGTPEFYQYTTAGGPMSIRGYIRDRFWGNTAFYNRNELRYLTDFRSFLMNGKIGLLGLYDQGRVWYKGEQSNTWHYAVGGGVLLAPFNKFVVTGTYAQASDGGVVQVTFNTLVNFNQ